MLNILWHFQADRLVKDKITENSDALLRQSQRVIDERIREIRNTAINIAIDSDVRKYINSSQNQTVNIYTNYLIDKTFNKYISTNPFVDMMFIYSNEAKLVLSVQDNSYSPCEFFRRNAEILGGTEENWLNRLYSPDTNVFVNNGNGQNGALTYLINIPFSSRKANSSKLGICLKRSAISDVFSASDLPERTLSLIVDFNGNVLYADGNDELASLFSFDENVQHGNRIVKSDDNTRFMVSHIKSDEADLSYCFITPCSVYMKHSTNFRILTYIIVAFGAATGILLSLHFAKKSSRPIIALSKIIDMDLSGNVLLNEPKEWKNIENAVRKRLNSAEDVTLYKLLVLNEPLSSEQFLPDMHMQFPYSRFVAAVIDIFDMPDYLKQSSSDEMQYVLNNVAADVCRITGTIKVIYYEPKRYAAILNISDEINDADEEISAFFSMLREIMQLSLSIDAFISVGSIHNGTAGISQSFAEARQIRDCMPLMRDRNTICFKNFQNISGSNSQYDYPISEEIQIIGYIKTGNEEKTLSALKQLIERNFSLSGFTVSMARDFLIQIQNTFIKAFKDLNISFGDIYGDDGNPFKSLPAALTFDETMLFLSNHVQKICSYVSVSKNNMNKKKIEKIIAYINENYANPVLSLCMISDNFHMNQAYLSTFFREQTGENFITFIRKIKIEKAKELLKNTNLSLRVIAEQTGYNSSSILIQNFRRETGITPNQYRTEVLSE